MSVQAREYLTLGCNDTTVICYASIRRALQEFMELSSRHETWPQGYPGRSFQALMAFSDGLHAEYGMYVNRRVMDKMAKIGPQDGSGIEESVVRKLVENLLKGVDQVNASRVGMILANEIIRTSLISLLEDADSEMVEADAEVDFGPEVRLDAALGLIAGHLPVCEELLMRACQSFVDARFPERGNRKIEVIAHDLTAPLLVICPDARTPVLTATSIDRQMRSAIEIYARDRIPDFGPMVLENMDRSDFPDRFPPQPDNQGVT